MPVTHRVLQPAVRSPAQSTVSLQEPSLPRAVRALRLALRVLPLAVCQATRVRRLALYRVQDLRVALYQAVQALRLGLFQVSRLAPQLALRLQSAQVLRLAFRFPVTRQVPRVASRFLSSHQARLASRFLEHRPDRANKRVACRHNDLLKEAMRFHGFFFLCLRFA